MQYRSRIFADILQKYRHSTSDWAAMFLTMKAGSSRVEQFRPSARFCFAFAALQAMLREEAALAEYSQYRKGLAPLESARIAA